MARGLYYSQSWEDWRLIEEALIITSDDVVVSATKGGDNTISFMAHDVSRVYAVNEHKKQNFLCEIKLAVIRTLSREDTLAALGYTKSEERLSFYKDVLPLLSIDARDFFNTHADLFVSGIIHAGKLEHYVAIIRRFIFPLIFSEEVRSKILVKRNKGEQALFYNTYINVPMWRMLFYLFFNGVFVGLFARNPGTLKYAVLTNIAKTYLAETRRVLSLDGASENPYLHYLFTGSYTRDALPYYVREDFIEKIKRSKTEILYATESLSRFLISIPSNTITKWDLSDIFETYSQIESQIVFQEIYRTSKNGAKIIFWNNLVDFSIPESMKNFFVEHSEVAATLHQKEQIPFYRKLIILEVVK